MKWFDVKCEIKFGLRKSWKRRAKRTITIYEVLGLLELVHIYAIEGLKVLSAFVDRISV